MSRYAIVNVFEDCEDNITRSPQVEIHNVSRLRAERCKDWACGIQIGTLNIFCELSPEATMYLLSRCRSRVRPIIQFSTSQELVGKGVGVFDRKADASATNVLEWLKEVYETNC